MGQKGEKVACSGEEFAFAPFQVWKQDPHPDLDPLVGGMDPRIRIRTKISWIRNTAR